MTRDTERWRSIPGSEDYLVSDLGNIVHLLPNGTWRPIRATVNVKRDGSKGYLKVCLGRSRQEYIHILVVLAFVGVRPHGSDVDHVDHNRLNCRLSNLRYRPVHDNRGDQWREGVDWEAWDRDAGREAVAS